MYWNTRRQKKEKSQLDYVLMKHPLPVTGNVHVMGVKFCGGYAVVAKDTKIYHAIKRIPIFKGAKEFPLSFMKQLGWRCKDVEMIFGHDVYCHYMESIGLTPQGKPIVVESEEKSEETDKVVAFEKEEVADIKEEFSAELSEEKEELDSELELSEPEEAEEEPEEEHIADLEEPKEEEDLDELPELSPQEIAAAHKEQGLCSYISDDKVCNNKASVSSPSGFCFGHIRFDPERKNKGKKERRRRKKEAKEE